MRYRRSERPEKKLMVLQAFHSFDSIEGSGHHELITQAELDGFFDKTVTVYPILGANPFDNSNAFSERRRILEINSNHSFYEFKFNCFRSRKLQTAGFFLSQFLMLLELRQLILRENIGVIRGNCPFLTGTYALVLSMWTKVPFSLRIGGNFDLMNKNGLMSYQRIFKRYWVQKLIARVVFRYADDVCAVNINNMNYCIDNGAKPEKCSVVRYGNVVDEIHYSDPESRATELLDFEYQDRRIVLCVGRLTKVKHPEDVLEVAKIVCGRLPDVHFVFVGEGEMKPELLSQAKIAGIDRHVQFLGNRNQEYLAQLYGVSEVYLSPLTGRSLVEAALAALPLVAYDYEWHSEIVVPNKSGVLVAYRGVYEMAEELVSLLKNQALIEELGAGARNIALDMMNKNKIREQEVSLFRNLLAHN